MRREEKRRKFHEAVLNTLYPQPASPPPHVDEEDKDDKIPSNKSDEDFDVGLINPDDCVRDSTSGRSDDDGDGDEGSHSRRQKPTRAQRKRLRKKKLKEDAACRRKIIGPLLPPTSDEGNQGRGCGRQKDSPRVRQNADEECAVTCDKSRELSGCCNQKKLKQRRMAKRQARERLKLSSMENNGQQ